MLQVMLLVIPKGKPLVSSFSWAMLLVAGSREKWVGGADLKTSHVKVREVEISWDWRNDASRELELNVETLCLSCAALLSHPYKAKCTYCHPKRLLVVLHLSNSSCSSAYSHCCVVITWPAIMFMVLIPFLFSLSPL